MLQDRAPVKFKDPMFKHENFREFLPLKLFHNYCLQSIFSVVEIIIELFVVCQKLIINFKVTNLTLYMYLFIGISLYDILAFI